MTKNTLHTSPKKFPLTKKIKYKDLAIAVALSSASLLFIPTAAKAASTTPTDTTSDPTTSSQVTTTGDSTTGSADTTAGTTATGDTSTTGSATGTSTTGTDTTTTGTTTGSSTTGANTGSTSTTGTGADSGSTSTTGTGSDTGSTTTPSTGADTGSATTPGTGADSGSTSTTGTGSDSGSTSTTGTGADTGSTSTTGTGADSGSTSTTGTGSDTGSTSTTGTGADTGSTSTTGTGSDTGSTSTTGTGSDTGSTSTTGTGSDTGSTSTTGTGSDTGSTTAPGTDTGPTADTTATITISAPTPSTVPATGISQANVASETPITNNQYTVCIQAVGTDGKALGAVIPVTTTQEGNSTYTLNWSSDYLTQLANSIPNSANYTAWDPDALTGSLAVKVTDSNVVVSVYYALKQVTATYTFVDENTGETLGTETNTFDFTSANGNAGFKANGIKPSDATLSSDTHLLTADDPSTAAQTDASALPYFGPTGAIFNDTAYVLDAAKTDGATPLTYTGWPAGNISETFYYKDATAPTVAICAIDSNGNIIKTFNEGESPTATLPSQQVTAAAYLPSVADATIDGYTITGVTATAADSLSKADPTVVKLSFTPEQYAAFLASPEATTNYDTRGLGDYQDLAIQFTYQGKSLDLTVQPVDADGNKIGDPIPVGSGYVGENLTLTNPTVSGYSPVAGTTTAVTLAAGQGPIEVQYAATTPSTSQTGGSSSTGTTTETPGTGSSTGTGTTTQTPGTGSSTSTGTATEQPGTGSSTATGTATEQSGNSSTASTGSVSAGTSSGSTASTTGSATQSGASVTATQPATQAATTSPKAPSYVASKTTTSPKLVKSSMFGVPATSSSKLPQTGNKMMTVLSAVGIALMGVIGLCGRKIKQLF